MFEATPPTRGRRWVSLDVFPEVRSMAVDPDFVVLAVLGGFALAGRLRRGASPTGHRVRSAATSIVRPAQAGARSWIPVLGGPLASVLGAAGIVVGEGVGEVLDGAAATAAWVTGRPPGPESSANSGALASSAPAPTTSPRPAAIRSTPASRQGRRPGRRRPNRPRLDRPSGRRRSRRRRRRPRRASGRRSSGGADESGRRGTAGVCPWTGA